MLLLALFVDCVWRVVGDTTVGHWLHMYEINSVSDPAEGQREFCQVPSLPLDSDAGAHLQDFGQYACRGMLGFDYSLSHLVICFH